MPTIRTALSQDFERRMLQVLKIIIMTSVIIMIFSIIPAKINGFLAFVISSYICDVVIIN